MVRTKFGRVRDQQRQKVYDWEREIIWDNIEDTKLQMPLKDCEKLVYKALIWWYRIGKPLPNGRPPSISMPLVIPGRENTSARGGRRVISLPSWARVEGPVLHETAHCIVDTHGLLKDDGGHGPYFMRVYIELMGHYLHINRPEMTLSAKKSGIKVHPMSKINRPKP